MPPEEAVIAAGLKPTSLAFADAYVAEDEILAQARTRAAEVEAHPVSAGTGATLRFVASLLDARAVVEVGTGCGVSGLWMMRGMASDGVLTSVDVEAEHQRLAKLAFAEAGVPHQRARFIPGAALDVLPRLTQGHYDLVFCDADKSEYPAYLEQALRLLKPGGVVAFDNTLWHDKVAETGSRDAATVAIRETLQQVTDDERLRPVLLPVGDGLLLAHKP